MIAGDTFAAFESAAKAAGFDTVLERRWNPGQVVDTHSHPFAVSAQVVDGEMWLTVDGDTRHIVAGGHFELAADLPHAERYGPAGAVFWVARRTD